MKNIVYVLLIFILTNKCFGIEYAYGSEDSGFFTGERTGAGSLRYIYNFEWNKL